MTSTILTQRPSIAVAKLDIMVRHSKVFIVIVKKETESD